MDKNRESEESGCDKMSRRREEEEVGARDRGTLGPIQKAKMRR